MPVRERASRAGTTFAPTPVMDTGAADAADELSRGVGELCRRRGIPGMAVALLRRGETTRTLGYGLADPERGRPVDADTLWPFFSVTKLFTAVALLQLVEDGRVRLQDDVRDHLPWLQPRHAGQPPARLTVTQLLAHQSGFTRTRDSLSIHLADEPGPDLRALAERLAAQPLAYAPGTGCGYSNTNYVILGALIEAVAGRPYEEQLRTRVLVPLGLTSTSFAYTPASLPRAAIGCVPVWSLATLMLHFIVPSARRARLMRAGLAGQRQLAPFYIDGAPFGGLLGTLGDLAAFMRFHVDSRNETCERVLPWRYRQLMQRPHGGAFGLGWHISGGGSQVCLSHSGGGPGFKSGVCLMPGEGFGTVVLMNTFVLSAVEHDVTEMAHGLEARA